MAAWWVGDEEKASEHRQRKLEAEEADKVEIAPGVTVVSLRHVGGLSLFNESFPNEGSTKPPWGWVKASRRLREGFSVSSRSLQRPRRLHEALVKTSRTLRDCTTASPLRECFMKAPS